jgi:hypothetical protein
VGEFDDLTRRLCGAVRGGDQFPPFPAGLTHDDAGQKLITGALGAFDAAPGQHWHTSFEGLGDGEVRFA